MADAPVLSRRELNRATLARQLLLAREALAPEAAIERLAGLQAQQAMPPYVGLWTRLEGFAAGDLTDLLEARRVVRAPLMRHTLHLMTASDFTRLRTAIQPALTRSWRGIHRGRFEGLDVDAVVAAAREFMRGTPRRSVEVREHLASLWPDRDPAALAYTARTHVPMVQLPSRTAWGYANTAPYALPEEWLGAPPVAADDAAELVRRYLAAFGPASVRDAQAWSGRPGLKTIFEQLRPELIEFRGEDGVELFDLPDAPRPPADTPAPARLLPAFDNLVLSHADRTRVLAEEHRPRVSMPAGRVAASFLVDGEVAGTWTLERGRVELSPFAKLRAADRSALRDEAERLRALLA